MQTLCKEKKWGIVNHAKKTANKLHCKNHYMQTLCKEKGRRLLTWWQDSQQIANLLPNHCKNHFMQTICKEKKGGDC